MLAMHGSQDRDSKEYSAHENNYPSAFFFAIIRDLSSDCDIRGIAAAEDLLGLSDRIGVPH